MVSLKFVPMIKAEVSNNNLPSNNTPKHSVPSANNGNIQPSSSKAPPFPQLKQKQLKLQKPSITEIERVIGAGVFRDRDTERDESEKTLLDMMMANSIGKEESSVEKQLREAGEWILDKTENNSQASGKKILLFVFQWLLPTWIFAIMVALGIIELPFSTPLLDNLLS